MRWLLKHCLGKKKKNKALDSLLGRANLHFLRLVSDTYLGWLLILFF